jgi:hypothetical protein
MTELNPNNSSVDSASTGRWTNITINLKLPSPAHSLALLGSTQNTDDIIFKVEMKRPLEQNNPVQVDWTKKQSMQANIDW